MLYYILTIFLSAFLLFQIQPLISKYILPWYGGSPAVWSTAMLFFQTLLLAGYAYAYGLIVRLPSRKKEIVHMVLCAVSLVGLVANAFLWPSPITPGAEWRSGSALEPAWAILILLFVSVGLPYFVLSTNSPIMQAWFNERYAGRSPYWLYALSNVASLLALLTYPALVEPALNLRVQGWIWTAGYALFAILVMAGAMHRLRMMPAATDPSTALDTNGTGEIKKPSSGVYLLWISLAAVASILLLAVTSQITQEVAAIPFLWVLPLSIYLLSFILTFSSDRWYWRGFYGFGVAVVSALVIWILLQGVQINFIVQISGYSVFLFVNCMFLHGELVRLKPDSRYLTSFYLSVSLGGALGGVFVNFAAPYLFTGYWELQIGIVACWVLLLVAFLYQAPGWHIRWRAAVVMLVVIGGIIVADLMLIYVNVLRSHSFVMLRNFYGVQRVALVNPDSEDKAFQLTHGATTHGFQFLDESRKRQPTAYYTENSGVGKAISFYRQGEQVMQIGVLGLGVGTLATYGQPGDAMRFYEINPDVIRLAGGEGGYFSFLSDCPCQVSVVEGDARLSLEQELTDPQQSLFDFLVIDAFSSDSIPTHLLTVQAFDIYMQRIKADGVLALHVTNRSLNLLPVVRRLADYQQLSGVVVEHNGDLVRSYPSQWVILSRNQEYLEKFLDLETSYPLSSVPGNVTVWTDDFSNLFQLLR